MALGDPPPAYPAEPWYNNGIFDNSVILSEHLGQHILGGHRVTLHGKNTLAVNCRDCEVFGDNVVLLNCDGLTVRESSVIYINDKKVEGDTVDDFELFKSYANYLEILANIKEAR